MRPHHWTAETEKQLIHALAAHKLPKVKAWVASLCNLFEAKINPERYGDLPLWLESLEALPKCKSKAIDLNLEAPQIGLLSEIDTDVQSKIKQSLLSLKPWRKGPFNAFGIGIDAEWRSELKWQRIAPHLDLTGQRILDVGCGNGYYALRSLGMGAKTVVGIDPTLRFMMQWAALAHFIEEDLPFWFLPATLEELPEALPCFDTIFSMGVLYHRRDPLDHIQRLKMKLAPKGQIILETLVVPGDQNSCLIPEDRYARMRNVWFLPSIAMMEVWLRRMGFKSIELLDQTPTTPQEQRVTEWMSFQSLENFLDPEDPSLTIEGHPGPLRATWRIKLKE